MIKISGGTEPLMRVVATMAPAGMHEMGGVDVGLVPGYEAVGLDDIERMSVAGEPACRFPREKLVF